MNLNNLILGILATTSICLATVSQETRTLAEASRNPQVTWQKSANLDSDFVYSKNINHLVLGARIITQFSPRDSQGKAIELQTLASRLGYDHFNWVNYVETDPHGISDRQDQLLTTPYNDPPQGGYHYDPADEFPFYWDVVSCELCNQRHHFENEHILKQFSLVFEDAPADYRLQPGEAVEFITSLVGVKAINPGQQQAEWEVLHTFRWKLTNPNPYYSQVSLVDTSVDLSELSPLLLNAMALDGAVLYSEQ